MNLPYGIYHIVTLNKKIVAQKININGPDNTEYQVKQQEITNVQALYRDFERVEKRGEHPCTTAPTANTVCVQEQRIGYH
jgi:hypothetical protein